VPGEGAGIRFGHYVLLRRIARGGMAEVFLAQQRGLEGFDRRVAVKRILPHLADAPDFVKMFLGEAKLAAQLTHPNIVHIYEFGKVEADYFIAMEYVEGVHAGDLFRRVADGDRLSPAMVARIGADAAAALHYAHELRGPNGKRVGLVHRDVSPANVMVSFDGIVKLCDFGIAKAAAISDQLTNPGTVKGKYAYMSPEQTTGSPLDGRSDVFALSIILWELLAGKTIVPRGDAVEAMRMIRDGKLMSIERAAPDVPPALASAITWGLQTKRERRPAAMELAHELESFLKSSPELATSMQLGTWLRARFPRDAVEGEALAPGTQAAPGTHAGESTGGIRPIHAADTTGETVALPVPQRPAPPGVDLSGAHPFGPPEEGPTVLAPAYGDPRITRPQYGEQPRTTPPPYDEPAPRPPPDPRATRPQYGDPRARPPSRPPLDDTGDPARRPADERPRDPRITRPQYGDPRSRRASQPPGYDEPAPFGEPAAPSPFGEPARHPDGAEGPTIIAPLPPIQPIHASTRPGPGAPPAPSPHANAQTMIAPPDARPPLPGSGPQPVSDARPLALHGSGPQPLAGSGGYPAHGLGASAGPGPLGTATAQPALHGAGPVSHANAATVISLPNPAIGRAPSVGGPSTLYVDPATMAARARAGLAAASGQPGRGTLWMQPRPRVMLAIGALVLLAIVSFAIALAARGTPAGPPDAAVVAPGPADAAPADAAPTDARTPTIPSDAAPTTGSLEVRTRPDGATIKIAGEPKGVAPTELALPAGRYFIDAELEGWMPERRAVELVAGERVVQEIVFGMQLTHGRVQTGRLIVRTTPPCEVLLGTRRLADAPLDIAFDPGTYTLQLKHPRHATVVRRVTIAAGKTTRLIMALP
jgi:serine/threonine-protein kinase